MKVTIDVPDQVLEWYRRIAKYYKQPVETQIVHELCDLLAGKLDDTDFVAEFYSVDIVESGLLEILKEHDRELSWIEVDP